MFCNQCGKEIDNSATVCPYCNSKVQPIAPPQPEPPVYEAPEQHATPIEPNAQPVQPTETAQPTQPTQQAQPIQPTEPSQQAQGYYYQPQAQADPMANPAQPTQVKVKKAPDKKTIIIAAAAAAVAVILIVLIATLGGSSPKKSATKIIKAYENNDMKTAIEYSFPYDEKAVKYRASKEYFDKYLDDMYYDDIDEYYDDLADKYDYTGIIKDENDALDAYIKYLEELNADSKKDTYEIIDVKKYDKGSSKYEDAIDELDEMFDSEYFEFDTDYYNTKNISGYAVVKLKITDEDGESRKSNIEMVKFKGKWYSMSSYFDFGE